jgi:hypothetical protein
MFGDSPTKVNKARKISLSGRSATGHFFILQESNMSIRAVESPDSKASLPWWRYWQVWMVVLGPAVVVVASVATYFIAASGQDPVLSRDGGEISKRSVVSEKIVVTDPNMAPALVGRNHAATGVKPNSVAP